MNKLQIRLKDYFVNLSISFKLWFKNVKQNVFTNKKAMWGLGILLGFLLFSLFGPLIWPYNPITDENNKFLAPSIEHIFGTDNLGRDLFRQMVYGSRDVLTIAFFTSVFSVFIGVLLGLLSGLVGGWLDNLIMMIVNLFLTIPSFPIMLIMASFFTIEDPFTFALVLSIWSWAGMCRAVRSQIISLRERDFILICKVENLSRGHIIFQELLPNIYSYVLINFIQIMKGAITSSVGIMMLGLAAFEPSNWGAILLRAKDIGALLIPEATLFWLIPILSIALFQTGAILLVDGLDEALNPRLRRN
ncbi:MAG: ABC transporter permease [Bacilli bacterium]|jgi:peptide/nickel transport system permease protein|nr:ABC transporter permease [Bacilli bacterium]